MKIGNCHSDEKVSQFWQQALAFLVDARLVDWSIQLKPLVGALNVHTQCAALWPN